MTDITAGADAHDPVDILARTIWGEARGEGADGMRAIACVVLNRVGRPCWWGRDIVSVCLKKFQFSCWNATDPNLEKLQDVTTDDPAFLTATEIAQAAIAGSLADITNGATSYKVTSLPWPHDWGHPTDPVAVIGRHSFYNLS